MKANSTRAPASASSFRIPSASLRMNDSGASAFPRRKPRSCCRLFLFQIHPENCAGNPFPWKEGIYRISYTLLARNFVPSSEEKEAVWEKCLYCVSIQKETSENHCLERYKSIVCTLENVIDACIYTKCESRQRDEGKITLK